MMAGERVEQRTKKQVIIVCVFLAAILIIVFFAYILFWKPPATCVDNIQNQKEEGIDCGGPCQVCEIKNLKNIEILWVKALATQNQDYDLLARVVNSNQNYGSGKFSYEFQLFDLNDNLIASRQGEAFILPREEKYIAERKISAGVPVSKVKLNILPISWEKIKDYEPPEIQIFSKKFEIKNEYPIFAEASGIAKNSGRLNFEKIKVIIVLFGANNEPIAINSVDVDRLDAGQEKFFSAPWYFGFSTAVVRVDAEPQMNVFK